MKANVLLAVAATGILAAGVTACSASHPGTTASTTATSPVPSEMSWQTADVTAIAGAPSAAFVLPVSYVSEGRKTEHLVYIGFADSHIHDLWRDNAGWHTDDPTAATGAPAPLGPLAGYESGSDGGQHVLYVGESDQHIQELWSDATGWHTDDLTAATGAPPAGAGALLAYPSQAQHTDHVFYRDANMATPHIHELWKDAAGWHTDDLTAATGAPAPGTGDLAGYSFESQGTLHAFYIGAQGHIFELWRDSAGWHADDLTAASGAPKTSGPLAAYAFPAQGTQHVIFDAGSGANDHVHEVWWDGSGPHTDDLTDITGVPGAGLRDFVAYAWQANGSQHVFNTFRDEHVHELWWDATGGHTNDLTAATGAPPPGSKTSPNGTGLTGYPFVAQGTQHLFYVSYLDNHIHELWWGPRAPAQPPTSPTTAPSPTAPSTPARAGAGFLGSWNVHGASMTITPTTATIVATDNTCDPFCSETDTLAVTSGDDTHLTLTVTAVNYKNRSGAAAPPPPRPSTAVGDSLQLEMQAPGLLKESILHGFSGEEGGNPYWCGAGISQINHRLCGA